MVELFRINKIEANAELSKYCNDIAIRFCPFLKPSMEEDKSFFSIYVLNNTPIDFFEKFIFCSGVFHTIIFRKKRERENSQRGKILMCENIIYNTDSDIDGEALFAWPHWFLKLLFTEKSILFGKFWKGEKKNTADNIPITEPPIHMLSIRSAVKPTDKKFFNITPELSSYYLSSTDDSESVFNYTSTSVKALINMIENIDIIPKNINTLIYALCESSLYEETITWAIKKEQELGIENYTMKKRKNGSI